MRSEDTSFILFRDRRKILEKILMRSHTCLVVSLVNPTELMRYSGSRKGGIIYISFILLLIVNLVN